MPENHLLRNKTGKNLSKIPTLVMQGMV